MWGSISPLWRHTNTSSLVLFYPPKSCIADNAVDIKQITFFFAFPVCHPIRHKILGMLCKNPPFTKTTDSALCNEALVDQLWKLMNSGKKPTVGGTEGQPRCFSGHLDQSACSISVWVCMGVRFVCWVGEVWQMLLLWAESVARYRKCKWARWATDWVTCFHHMDSLPLCVWYWYDSKLRQVHVQYSVSMMQQRSKAVTVSQIYKPNTFKNKNKWQSKVKFYFFSI